MNTSTFLGAFTAQILTFNSTDDPSFNYKHTVKITPEPGQLFQAVPEQWGIDFYTQDLLDSKEITYLYELFKHAHNVDSIVQLVRSYIRFRESTYYNLETLLPVNIINEELLESLVRNNQIIAVFN